MPVEKKNQMPLNDQMDGPAQQYCLRWKYHHSNLQEMFAVLLERESFCDVTLACEGKTLRAHKVVLSACSTYFDTVFSKHEERDPIVILKDVKFNDLKAVVEFMYKGEINVDNSQLTTLLQTAEDLKIKGLAAVSWKDEEKEEEDDESSVEEKIVNNQPKARKRKIKYDPQYVYPNAKVACIDNQPQPVEVYGSQSDEDSEPTYDKNKDEEEDEEEKEKEINEKSPEPDDNKPVTSTPQASTPSTPTIRADLLDVIKMTAYIQQGGRRPHFWETSSTKRVMEAIKNKEIEMKVAAEILGVSYGTLYGRYRDAYGCLKHPYRVREFWHEAPSIEVIGKLQRKELSLFKAAEILNVTVTTLANYLAALNKEDNMAAFISQDDECEEGMKTKTVMTPDLSIVKEEAPDEASNSINGN